MNSGRRGSWWAAAVLAWVGSVLVVSCGNADSGTDVGAPAPLARANQSTSTTSMMTSTTAPTTTMVAASAPSTTVVFEDHGPQATWWGTPFTATDQGVAPVFANVVASLAAVPEARVPCPPGQAVTVVGRAILADPNDPPGTTVPAAFGADSLVLITPAGGGLTRPVRLSPQGAMTDVALPPGALGAVQAVGLPGGGAIVTTIDAIDGIVPDVANASYLDPSGTWTRLTGYRPSLFNTTGRRLIVSNLRVGPSGRVIATLQQTSAHGARDVPQSTELVIDPKTRTISATATSPGQVIFDVDVAGNAVVGVDRGASIQWRDQDGSNIGPVACDPN